MGFIDRAGEERSWEAGPLISEFRELDPREECGLKLPGAYKRSKIFPRS